MTKSKLRNRYAKGYCFDIQYIASKKERKQIKDKRLKRAENKPFKTLLYPPTWARFYAFGGDMSLSYTIYGLPAPAKYRAIKEKYESKIREATGGAFDVSWIFDVRELRRARTGYGKWEDRVKGVQS